MPKDVKVILASEIPILRKERRLDKDVLVVRVKRSIRGGGAANLKAYPYAWSVEVTVEGTPHVVYSARGERREWTDLGRLARWLEENGFRNWCVRNEAE